MRELTIRLKFTKHSLGNVKSRVRPGAFIFARSPQGNVTFLSSWHSANMRLASQLLGRHQDEVAKIFWDINVDGAMRADCWYQRYYRSSTGKNRYVLHEAFFPGQTVGINCVVPAVISDDDFWRLMQIAGQYRGLSPWHPSEYGFFSVDTLRPRRKITLEADVPVEIGQEEVRDK